MATLPQFPIGSIILCGKAQHLNVVFSPMSFITTGIGSGTGGLGRLGTMVCIPWTSRVGGFKSIIQLASAAPASAIILMMIGKHRIHPLLISILERRPVSGKARAATHVDSREPVLVSHSLVKEVHWLSLETDAPCMI